MGLVRALTLPPLHLRQGASMLQSWCPAGDSTGWVEPQQVALSRVPLSGVNLTVGWASQMCLLHR